VNYYLKYRINKKSIFELLNSNNNDYKQLNFYLDLSSIARGLYNKNLIILEVSNYLQNNKVLPTTFLNELRLFLNDLYNTFQYYHPRFIIFYDDGNNNQNKSISKGYKSNRVSASQSLVNHINSTPQVKQIFEAKKNIENYDQILNELNIIKSEKIEAEKHDPRNIEFVKELLELTSIDDEAKVKIQKKILSNTIPLESIDVQKDFGINDEIIQNQIKELQEKINKRQSVVVKTTDPKDQLTGYQEEEFKNTFKLIKSYYFTEIENKFNIPGLSKVIYMQEYETDFVPYFYLNNGFESDNNLNIILSMDKDLLQCCKFKNTVQLTTNYLPSQSKIVTNIYDNENAISYIYDNFKKGILTAEYIPMILAISGDKADGISGVPGYGYANAIKSIMRNHITPEYPINVPAEFESFKEKLQKNYKMICFKEQISRLPLTTKIMLEQNLNF
jgi:5'-3' exonuclease